MFLLQHDISFRTKKVFLHSDKFWEGKSFVAVQCVLITAKFLFSVDTPLPQAFLQ